MTLNRNMRLLIVGGPSTGKTTLSDELSAKYGLPHYHTDDIINEMKWSEVSRYVADSWFVMRSPWIIEGVAVVRALRKWYKEFNTLECKPPCDIIIKLDKPRIRLTAGQENMMKGHETVWKEVLPSLKGIEIIYQ